VTLGHADWCWGWAGLVQLLVLTEYASPKWTPTTM